MNNENEISLEELEQIENYLLAGMHTTERTQFEEQLQQDKRLQAKADELNGIFNGIKQAAYFQKMSEWHETLESKTHKPAMARIINYNAWKVAAIILVCCVGAWLIFFSKNKEEKLYAKYYKPDFGLVTAMSATDNFAFDKAMIDYKSGNYEMAINTWQQMLAQRPGSDTLLYFIGSSYLAIKDYEKATVNLKKVVSIKQSLFVQDAYWYLGLSALQLGNSKDASIYISQSDHAKKEALLNELRK